MSVRTSLSLRRWLAAVLLLPVLAAGYVAADPGTLPVKLRMALLGEDAKGVPAAPSSFWLTPAVAAIEKTAPAPEPRVTIAYRVGGDASAGLATGSAAKVDDTVTGSLPRASDLLPVVVTVKKSDRYLTPRKSEEVVEKPDDPESPLLGANLYLSRVVADLTPYSPAVQPDQEEIEEDTVKRLASLKNKGVTYQGETEAEFQERERRCLATAIYFEARGEPIGGQEAVAQVVMNRVRSPDYPDTICGVVYQGQHRRTGCQFSFTCDGKADVAKDEQRWEMAMELARKTTAGKVWLNDIGHATHYHANYVSPRWIREMNRIQRIGAHIFYKLRNEKPYEVAPAATGNPERGLALAPNG